MKSPGSVAVSLSGMMERRGISSPVYTAISVTGFPYCSSAWVLDIYSSNTGISLHHVLSRWKNVPMPSSVIPGVLSTYGLCVLTWKTMLLMPTQ